MIMMTAILVMANHLIKRENLIALSSSFQSLRLWKQEEMDNEYNMWAGFFIILGTPLSCIFDLFHVLCSCNHLSPPTPATNKSKWQNYIFTEHPTTTFVSSGWYHLASSHYYLDDHHWWPKLNLIQDNRSSISCHLVHWKRCWTLSTHLSSSFWYFWKVFAPQYH